MIDDRCNYYDATLYSSLKTLVYVVMKCLVFQVFYTYFHQIIAQILVFYSIFSYNMGSHSIFILFFVCMSDF